MSSTFVHGHIQYQREAKRCVGGCGDLGRNLAALGKTLDLSDPRLRAFSPSDCTAIINLTSNMMSRCFSTACSLAPKPHTAQPHVLEAVGGAPHVPIAAAPGNAFPTCER